MATVIYMHIYIAERFINIVIHRPTVSLYNNSSVRLDTRDAFSWDRNPTLRYPDNINSHPPK